MTKQDSTPRIFISHAGDDGPFANRLANDLRARGADVWLDTTHMGPGDFVTRMNTALELSDTFILVLSPSALQSPWVRQEMNACITRANQGLMRPPVVVMAQSVPINEIPPLWTVYHRYNATDDYQSALRHVARDFHLAEAKVASAESPAAWQPLQPQAHGAQKNRTSVPSRVIGLSLCLLISLIIIARVAIGVASEPSSPASVSPPELLGSLPNSVVTPHSGTPQSHVTILVLDMSGSMQRNDPEGLRCSAADTYLSLSGTGQFVGIIGFGGSSDSTSATTWAQPTEMATEASRQQLIQTLAQRSNNCQPNGNTPTYDALTKAYDMLQASTKDSTGSVILMTDGVPAPDTAGQISDIKSSLVPKFSAHNWPIDTIAIGFNSDVYGFLSDLSSTTSGIFYDAGHGIVPGVSPLNIVPSVISIFRVRCGKYPGPNIPPTQLNGGAVARDFTISNYISHFDIVVEMDSPGTHVSITSPDGQSFSTSRAGIFVSAGPHYSIFAIDGPLQGIWTVTASGAGLFLMDSLEVSPIGLAITAPDPNVPLVVGTPISITCHLTLNGASINMSKITLDGTIAPVGQNASSSGGNSASAPWSQDFTLASLNVTADYGAIVTVPTNASLGYYQISITAKDQSGLSLTSQSVMRVARFISVELSNPANSQSENGHPSTHFIMWDPGLQVIYRQPALSWLSALPLTGWSAEPRATVRGHVSLLGQNYAQAAVLAQVQRAGTSTTLPAQLFNDGNGSFHLDFPADASGTYIVTVEAIGPYITAYGDTATATESVAVTVTPATVGQEVLAWFLTLIYALLCIMLALVIRALLATSPGGGLLGADSGRAEYKFAQAHRAPIFWLLHPAEVRSEQLGLKSGLRFRFRRNGDIWVQSAYGESEYQLDGEPVPAHPVRANNARLSLPNSSAWIVTIQTATVRPDAPGRSTDVGTAE